MGDLDPETTIELCKRADRVCAETRELVDELKATIAIARTRRAEGVRRASIDHEFASPSELAP